MSPTEVLYSSMTADEKIKSLSLYCSLEEKFPMFDALVDAIDLYTDLTCQNTMDILFREFVQCKDRLRIFSPSLYYILLEWKDSNLSSLRHLIPTKIAYFSN